MLAEWKPQPSCGVDVRGRHCVASRTYDDRPYFVERDLVYAV
jgi:hypothetical protein